MSKARNFLQSDTEKFVCDKTAGVSLGAVDKPLYVNHQKTDVMESVALSVAVRGLGEVQLIYPYRKGLAEELNQKCGHATIFNFSDVAIYKDLQVGIYENALTLKFIVSEKE